MSPAATSTLKKMLKKDLQELVHQLEADAKRKDQELAATKSQLDKYQQSFEQSENILQMTQDLSDSQVSELQAHMRAQEFKAQALAAELRVEHRACYGKEQAVFFPDCHDFTTMRLIKNMAGASTSEREAQIAECQAQNEYLTAQMAQCLEENSRLMSENDTLNKGVSVEMMTEFTARVNVPEVIPDDFDEVALLHAAPEADSIPPVTVDYSQAQYFSRLFDLEEVIEIKDTIRSRSPSACGWDRTSYDLFLALPNDLFLGFFNRCLETRAAPRLWLVAVLIGILKPEKDGLDPADYRSIDWIGILPVKNVHTAT
ncbi:hypothetical protein EDD18DRAFT_1351939 [Armillaria luteobubalina]|uniref:Uncharacterized protein n=1 Tax=Armillaria luteobubalina TaxID=153913 RepID=A0AA39Q858_9AGAR|nr:hypothetical protein EDD18DRAFT_1351939 [Armillaria luteobubalina]